jgi:hypothetical protein
MGRRAVEAAIVASVEIRTVTVDLEPRLAPPDGRPPGGIT